MEQESSGKTVHAENGVIKRESRAASAAPRSGSCRFCLRKHLLKVRGYAREVAEDATREWERDNLLENLLLAEDHATALEDSALVSEIRATRLATESGSLATDRAARLYERFKAKYFTPPGRGDEDTAR